VSTSDTPGSVKRFVLFSLLFNAGGAFYVLRDAEQSAWAIQAAASLALFWLLEVGAVQLWRWYKRSSLPRYRIVRVDGSEAP
jgi:lipoprotein signal peptidase